MRSRLVTVKVMLKYTSLGRLWSMRQVPRQSHVRGQSYKQGIPSDAKLESHTEAEILDISGQSDIEIYIIGSPLKYVPSLATIAHPLTELHIGEFPQMRNYKWATKVRSRLVTVKVMLKYTLLGRLWSVCQVLWRTVGCGRSYKQGNSLRWEITNISRSWDPARLWSKWHWNIHYWVASEVCAKPRDNRKFVDGATSTGIPSDAKLETHDEAEIEVG